MEELAPYIYHKIRHWSLSRWYSAILKNSSSPKLEKIKKDIQKLFKEKQLDIVVQCNMKTVNYLDVTLNLENSTYHPYQKKKSHKIYKHWIFLQISQQIRIQT